MVSLHVSWSTGQFGMTSSLPLCFDVENDTDNDLPSDLRLIFKENLHYRGTSRLVGRVDRRGARPMVKPVNMTLEVRSGANADTLQPTLDFELHSKTLGRNLLTHKMTLNQDFFRFTKDLNRFAPNQEEDDPPLNILVFGPAGAGKSAWLNTAFTLSSKSSDVNYHMVESGGGADHSTVRLWNKCLASHNNIALWDTWGVDPDNYKPDMLSALLDGRLPKNWEMTTKIEHAEVGMRTEDKKAFRKPHAVIFFLTLGDVNDGVMFPVLQQHFQAMKRHKFNPIVVIARADLVDPAIRSTPNGVVAAFEEARKTVADALHIGTAYIFPGVPYLSERQRSFEIDRLTYKILDEAVRAASANYSEAKQAIEATTSGDVLNEIDQREELFMLAQERKRAKRAEAERLSSMASATGATEGPGLRSRTQVRSGSSPSDARLHRAARRYYASKGTSVQEDAKTPWPLWATVLALATIAVAIFFAGIAGAMLVIK